MTERQAYCPKCRKPTRQESHHWENSLLEITSWDCCACHTRVEKERKWKKVK